MLLKLKRTASNGDSTVGELYVGNIFECFSLEDEKRTVKIKHETRIPAGEYDIKFQTAGEMTKKYEKKFNGIHKGMLWLQNVPNFSSIYIHIGNTDDDTSGCLLVGKSFDDKTWRLSNSTDAYIKLYVKVAQALLGGDTVKIKIVDETS